MKLFRQKDELFELMGRGNDRRRGSGVITTPSGIASPTPTTAKLPRPVSVAPRATPAITPAVTPPVVATAAPTIAAPTAEPIPSAAAPSLPTVTPRPPLNSTPSLRSLPMRPPPSLTPAIGGGPTTTPRLAPRAAPSLSTTTRKAGIRSPLLPGGAAGSEDDLFDLDGDALVVVDDGWEEQNAVTGPEKTFAIRADTAVVGSLLAGGLLLTAFLIGRTSSSPEAPDERPITPVVITAQADPKQATTLAASIANPAAPTAAAPTPSPVSQNAPTSNQTAAATTVAAGFQPQAEGEPRQANPGKYEVRVCTTTPEKAQALLKWLNEAPRSPIFGRGDLQVVVNGGSVKIQGFMQREAEVLSRVRATSDPTGGSGTFHDAYFASVR